MTETAATVFVVDDLGPMRASLENLLRSVGRHVELRMADRLGILSPKA